MELNREDLLMYGGVAFFLAFILYDIWTAYQRGAFWLPSKYMVIYGLLLQLAAAVEVKNLSISDADQQDQLQIFLAKQSSIDCARMTLCVFAGYLLPGMATADYAGVWTTVAALLVSLVSHIFVEYFVVVEFYQRKQAIQDWNRSKVSSIALSWLLLVILLNFSFVLLWAISVGKFYRHNLSGRIKAILTTSDLRDRIRVALDQNRNNLSDRIKAILDQNSDNVEMEWEKLKEEMLRSWIVARVCQPDYIITRSAFSAAVALLVTLCVELFSVNGVRARSVLVFFQSIFIVVACIVAVYRWLAPLYYFVLFTESLPPFMSQSREHFWIFQSPLNYLWHKVISSIPSQTKLQLILYWLLSPLILGGFIIYGYISYIAFSSMFLNELFWEMSWRIFDNEFVRNLSNADTKLGRLSSGDFGKYKEVLESLRMPAEGAASLRIANESCYKSVKCSMQEAYEKGGNYKKLIEVIGSCDENNLGFFAFADELVRPLPSVKRYFPALKEPLWSLTAASLLNMIIEVSANKDDNAVDDAVKAYNQAYDLMDLVGCPDNIDITVDFFESANPEAFKISKASNVRKKEVNKMYKMRKGKRPLTLENSLRMIREKRGSAESYLQRKHMLEKVPSADAQPAQRPSAGALRADWMAIAPSYVNCKVCNWILADSDCYSCMDELKKKLLDSFKDVISSCVLQLPDLLLKSCRDWAADFAEEKICKATKMVGTARGAIDEAKKRRREGTP